MPPHFPRDRHERTGNASALTPGWRRARTRPLATSRADWARRTNQVQFARRAADSAFRRQASANLGATNGLVTWATGSFVPANGALILNSVFADSEIEFQNPINLGAATRTVQVDDNTALTTDFATLSGSVTNGALVKTGAGKLVLAGSTKPLHGRGPDREQRDAGS